MTSSSVSDTTTLNERPNSTRSTPSRAKAAPSVTYDTTARVLRFAEPREDPAVVAAREVLSREPTVSDEASAAMASARARLGAEALTKLNEYVPDDVAEEHAAFIRTFVANAIILTLPQTTYSVEALQAPVTYFVRWAVYVVGCDLDAGTIFDRELIETYVREVLPKDKAKTDGTLRNYRAWITRVAEAVNPKMNPRRPMAMNDRSIGAPYSSADGVALDRWTTGQPTPYRRQGCATLRALAEGTGLTSSEIANLRRSSVTVRDDGLVEIEVLNGDKTRRVVVGRQHEKTIATQVRGIADDAFVFLPNRSTAEGDIVSAFVGRTIRPTGTPQVTVRRLRNTWFVTQLTNRVDVVTLMEAAGLQSLETISKLSIYVPRPDADERDAQLRGAL